MPHWGPACEGENVDALGQVHVNASDGPHLRRHGEGGIVRRFKPVAVGTLVKSPSHHANSGVCSLFDHHVGGGKEVTVTTRDNGVSKSTPSPKQPT